MNASKLLIPAVMLGAAVGASATIAPPKPAVTETTPAKSTVATVTPAVMGTRAPDSYPIPDKLQNYTDTKAERYAMRCQGSRCGSISGSDSGWDDSDQ